MHRKRTNHWAKLTAVAALLATWFWLTCGQLVIASPVNPEPVCVETTCTVTFDFQGEPYLWVPPSNASNLRFELYGGQGGQGARSIGLGGRVAGEFMEMPLSLLVYVGGRGNRGSAAEGAFNGGGDAGAGHGDEGSGGGATDLRSAPLLENRLVVAGGGGGAGGFNWGEAGLGGLGGSLVGGNGGWGQAAPGLGGGQFLGGLAGQPNGGVKGTSGDFGLGGAGASSRFAGGGGGGGGYYGGGGGGSDIDSSGLNGGGGGGGSSYANSEAVKNIVHDAGVRSEAGLAILIYNLVQSTPVFSMDSSVDVSIDISLDVSTALSTDVSLDLSSGAQSSNPLLSPTPEPQTTPWSGTPTEPPASQIVQDYPVSPAEPFLTVEPVLPIAANPLMPIFDLGDQGQPVNVLPTALPTTESISTSTSEPITLPMPVRSMSRPPVTPQEDSLVDLESTGLDLIPSHNASEPQLDVKPGQVSDLKAKIDWAVWIVAALVLSLAIGFIQTRRKLRQNRRAGTRRFV